jgi:hypothetical protein
MITISSTTWESGTKKQPNLRGVSMDVFVTQKGVKELEKHGEFEIYYLKKK